MFREYHHEIEKVYEIYADNDNDTAEFFSDIKNPYSLYNYIISRKAHSELALQYIEEELFYENPVYCTMFCLEYGYEIEDISSIKRLRLDKLDIDFLADEIFYKFWDLLQYEDYPGFILDVITHFQWTNYFYEALIEHGDLESKVCAELILEGKSTQPYRDAEDICKSLEYCKNEDDDTIQCYEGSDNVLPRIAYTELAIYYAKVGWNGMSLDYIKLAQKENTYRSLPEYNNTQLEQIKEKILTPYEKIYRTLEERLTDILGFLSQDAKEALLNAEYLFHVHGEALNEYSSIINGYAKCIEIQLKEIFSVKLHYLLEKYGTSYPQDVNKKYLIYLSYDKLKDKNVDKKFNNGNKIYTLGNFYHLFYIPHEDIDEGMTRLDELKWRKRKCLNKCQENCRGKADKEKKACERKCINDCKDETFYGAMYQEYSTGISFERLFQFGVLLKDITDNFRNEAAHSNIKDFNKVLGIRNKIGIGNKENIFELLYSTKGNPFKKDMII